jgi:hypothetical protein
MIRIMHFSPTFYHFITLRSKYSPQQPVLKHKFLNQMDWHQVLMAQFYVLLAA